jgi:hypothetical protein
MNNLFVCLVDQRTQAYCGGHLIQNQAKALYPAGRDARGVWVIKQNRRPAVEVFSMDSVFAWMQVLFGLAGLLPS